jgi:hypothetical protein
MIGREARKGSATTFTILTAVLLASSLVPSSARADVGKVKGLLDTLGGGDKVSAAKAAKQLADLDIGTIADAALDDGNILQSLRGLAGDSEREVASKAASGALKRLAPELGNRLPGALGDKDRAGKLIGAIGGLGSHGEGAAGQLVSLVGDSTQDAGLRRQAIGALGDIGSRGEDGMVEKALERATGDPDDGVSKAARDALGRLH